MLTPEHITALNGLTYNHQAAVITLAETWIRSSTTPAELIDFTPPGYSMFSAPRSYTSNPFKLISAGGTAFLIKDPFLHNSAAHYYSSFEYSSITLKFPKAEFTLFNIYRPPFPSPYSQTFNVVYLIDHQTLQFLIISPVVTSLRMLKFLLTDTVAPLILSLLLPMLLLTLS